MADSAADQPIDVISRGYRLAQRLHPPREIAREVLKTAAKFVPPGGADQQGLSATASAYNARPTTVEEFFQKAILQISLKWELDQEGDAPSNKPAYKPTSADMLARFGGCIARQTMFRRDSYPLVIAVGTCLYHYRPSEACDIAQLDDWRESKRSSNLRRLKQQTEDHITGRFQHTLSFHNEPGQPQHHALPWQTVVPDATQRTLVRETLTACAPWEARCLPQDQGIWEVSESERKHALLCHECAGFESLAKDRAMDHPHLDPDNMLRVPMFLSTFPPPTPGQDQEGPDQDDLDDIRAMLEKTLHATQRRRASSHFSRLRVYVDGVEQLQFGLAEHALQPRTLMIPWSATGIEVYGEDAEGLLPLTLFDVPEPDEERDAGQRMTAVLESGVTITLEFIPITARGGGEVTAWQVAIHFWGDEAEAPKDVEWCDAVLRSTFHSLELARMLGADTLGQELAAVVLPRLDDCHRALLRLTDNAARTAVLLADLGELYQGWNRRDKAQACWQASAALVQATGDPALAAALQSRLGEEAFELTVGQDPLPQPEVPGTGVRLWINETSYPLRPTATDPTLREVAGLSFATLVMARQRDRRNPSSCVARIEGIGKTLVIPLAKFDNVQQGQEASLGLAATHAAPVEQVRPLPPRAPVLKLQCRLAGRVVEVFSSAAEEGAIFLRLSQAKEE